MEWKGQAPQRFSGGRIHLKQEDSLNTLSSQPNFAATAPMQGLKTFAEKRSQQAEFRPSLKVYTAKRIEESKQIDFKGKKPLSLPPQYQRIRPEKMHVDGGGQTRDEWAMRGLRTFDDANHTTSSSYAIQTRLQRKGRIPGPQQQRNYVPVASAGDKSYKYPEYAPDFFKNGGLIVGSTQTYRGKMSDGHNFDNQIKSILTKPNWDVKVKMDLLAEEQRYLSDLDQWQKTTLKEGNPSYKDPETFFEREAAKAPPAKDAKKGGK